jgi:hypothetical protein
MINEFIDFLFQTQTDPLTPLLQYGAVGILAICALIGVTVLWRREVKISDAEREENLELRKELKELNTEIQKILLEIPRAQSDINGVVEIMRKLKSE